MIAAERKYPQEFNNDLDGFNTPLSDDEAADIVVAFKILCNYAKDRLNSTQPRFESRLDLFFRLREIKERLTDLKKLRISFFCLLENFNWLKSDVFFIPDSEYATRFVANGLVTEFSSEVKHARRMIQSGNAPEPEKRSVTIIRNETDYEQLNLDQLRNAVGKELTRISRKSWLV